MKRSALIIAIAFGFSAMTMAGADQKRVKTTRPHLERIPETRDSALIAPVDTLDASLLDSIALTGYDKPLRSRRESLFVTNATDVRITGLTLSIDYYDMKGAELHHREVVVPADIPPGATRQITFPSWDHQLTFVYYRSERSAKGVLYKIAAILRRVTVKR